MKDRVLYVDIEHQRLRPTEERWQRMHAARVGELAPRGVRCEYAWYGDLAPKDLEDPSLFAVFVSGNNAEWDEYAGGTPSLEPLKAFLASPETRAPILAVCGGHQLVAMAFGVKVDHMLAGMSESGFPPVQLAAPDDPIFAGLPARPPFMQSHHDEVTRVHPDFVLLASTPVCRIQALRHKSRVLYTTQFHPEQDRPEEVPRAPGSRLVQNFFSLASR